MLNSTLSESAAKIIANKSSAQFSITAHFISGNQGSDFSFYPFQINEIAINKDFLGNYGDEIDMKIWISPKDYALMQDQGQNLLCILTYTYLDKYGKTLYDPTPIRKQYNVMINDPRDVRKAIPDIQTYREPSTEMSVRLIETTIYKLRHTKLNTVYQNVTPTQAIHAITQSFGIEKLQMVELDNSHQYDHIEISSYQGIDSIFGYLHSKCGLYHKGANSYITDDVLYVYPPFETDPSYDKTAIFYQVDTGKFSGAHIFHKVENKNVSIVVNTQPHSYDLSVAGSENVGTGFVFTRASRLTDGFTTVDSKEGALFTDQPALSVILNTARTIQKDLNNLFHIKATDNPFPAMSHVISHQASLMEVSWMHADPFQIDPGHSVKYYYDENETMILKTGIVEKAAFRLTPMQRMDTKQMFGCVGQLTLRLSPNSSKTL